MVTPLTHTYKRHPPSMFICIITTGSMVWWLIRMTLGPGCALCWLAGPGWLAGVGPWPCWSDWPVDWGWPSAACLPLADIVTVVPRFNCRMLKVNWHFLIRPTSTNYHYRPGISVFPATLENLLLPKTPQYSSIKCSTKLSLSGLCSTCFPLHESHRPHPYLHW